LIEIEIMSSLGETNEQSCLSPLDSARFIMDRAKHVSIDISALEKLSSQVVLFFVNICLKETDCIVE